MFPNPHPHSSKSNCDPLQLKSVLLIRYYGFDALTAKAWACMLRFDSGAVLERLRFVTGARPGPARPSLRARCLVTVVKSKQGMLARFLFVFEKELMCVTLCP